MKESNELKEKAVEQMESSAGVSGTPNDEVWIKANPTPIELGEGSVGCPKRECIDAAGNPTVMSWDGNKWLPLPGDDKASYRFHCPKCGRQYAKTFVDEMWYERIY